MERFLITDKRKRKAFLFFVLCLLVLFFLSIYREKQKIERHFLIERNTEISFEAEQVWINHGAVFINDSIVIATGNSIVSQVPQWVKNEVQTGRSIEINHYTLADIEPPYQIFKKGNTLNFYIVKGNDTIQGKLRDPDYKDPNDPTFEDLFKQLFKGD